VRTRGNTTECGGITGIGATAIRIGISNGREKAGLVRGLGLESQAIKARQLTQTEARSHCHRTQFCKGPLLAVCDTFHPNPSSQAASIDLFFVLLDV
jgi:hypothetical protein